MNGVERMNEIKKRLWVMAPNTEKYRCARYVVRPIPDFDISEYPSSDIFIKDYAHKAPEMYYHSSEVKKLEERIKKLAFNLEKIFSEFSPEHIDYTSNTTCGTEAFKVLREKE